MKGSLRPWALVALLIAGVKARAQQAPVVPTFPAQAEAITVDVVVLDKSGRPMRGLKREHFTIVEDGKAQEIVGFEARDMAQPQSAEQAASAAIGLPRAEAGEDEIPGRTLAFIVDDLGLDGRAQAALEGIRKWVLEQADPRDELTLVTTSGEVEWKGRLGTGRGQALGALSRIRFRKPQISFFTTVDPNDPQPPPMTEWKAYQIASHRQEGSGEILRTAQMISDWWSSRARAIVSAIETFSHDHASERGRKSVFVFSQGFIRDDDLKQVDHAIDASQRGNTAVYFVDARGLVTAGEPGGRGLRSPQDGERFGDVAREAASHIDTAGAEQLATATGGSVVRDTNDLLGGLTRVVDESSAYYLLGYQQSKAPDGKWHPLEVKVGLAGVTVRARRGYLASVRPPSQQLRLASQTGTPQPQPAVEPKGETSPSTQSPPPAARPNAVPAFSAKAEAITVDVVVLDKDDTPVGDLTKDDFTLFEDGRPQAIVGFELRLLKAGPAPLEPDESVSASNQHEGAHAGRTLAFLIDDQGIEPLHMIAVAKALGSWLSSDADPRDEVTIATTSGDASWSDTVGNGRVDLDAVLLRIRGKKKLAAAQDSMSDWEGYNIDTLGSPIVEHEGPTGPPTGIASCTSNSPTPNILERVVDRWFRSGACNCDAMSVETSIRACRSLVQGRGRETYVAAAGRAAGLLAGVDRLSRGLAGARGRKSIIVLSEGLLRDTEQRAFDRAVDASRRGNTAVSFVDVRGLIGLSFYGADQSVAPKPGDAGTVAIEAVLLETAGGEYLAESTGGTTVRNTNDIAGAVTRLADQSSTYYLLAYQTDRPLDGKWRKLQVKVARPGLKVRARRGYFAKAEEPAVAMKATSKGKQSGNKGKAANLPTRPLDPVLSLASERDGIPLRIAPYVLETDATGEARVLVAIEVGTQDLTFTGAGGQRKAQLDLTILGLSRDQPKTVTLDSHAEMEIDARAVGGFWSFARELRLPAGPAQIRLLVRDTATGRTGLVSKRIEIPRADGPYLSALILGDHLTPPRGRAGAPKLVPAAHRSFRKRDTLYCAYEVYVAPGKELNYIPQVEGGYTLEDPDGQVVASAAPTPIAIALDAQITRMFSISLGRLAPGRYRLRVHAEEKKSGLNVEAHEVFVVEAEAGAGPKSN